MNELIEALRALAPEKKPTVVELAEAAGVDKISAKDRDAAWKTYQDEMQAEAGAESGGYRITVKQDGFRRAGRAWRGATEVAPGELSEEQLAALEADPMFSVEPL
jgi:hypothetical protein